VRLCDSLLIRNMASCWKFRAEPPGPAPAPRTTADPPKNGRVPGKKARTLRTIHGWTKTARRSSSKIGTEKRDKIALATGVSLSVFDGF